MIISDNRIVIIIASELLLVNNYCELIREGINCCGLIIVRQLLCVIVNSGFLLNK